MRMKTDAVVKVRAVGVAPVRARDCVSVGQLGKAFPASVVKRVVDLSGRQSLRQREIPAHVMVYYVIALGLYMECSTREVLRCLLEGGSSFLHAWRPVKVASKSGISQARTRLGAEPLRRLFDEVVRPLAIPATRGAFYRGLRVVSIDSSTMAVPSTEGNAREFGYPKASRGESAFPMVRFTSLSEGGTHVLFGTVLGPYREGEITQAKEVVTHLTTGMLCLADRNYYGFALWNRAGSQGADLLWRVKVSYRLPCETPLPDGSYLSTVYPTEKDRRHQQNGVLVRVIEYTLPGVEGADPVYRLVTTLLDAEKAPAQELAVLYHERWEIETAFGELKTRLRGGAHIILRSKTPELIRQEFYGLMLAHFVIRGLMHEAALVADEDPDRLSFLHTVRVLRRKLPQMAALPPSSVESLPPKAALRDSSGTTTAPFRAERAARSAPQDEQLRLASPRRAYKPTIQLSTRNTLEVTLTEQHCL